jgi:hypothetical protein
MGWKDTGDAERFNFEHKGDILQGKLIDMKQTREYDSKVYSLVDENDDGFYFFGCYALDSRLPALIGRRVKITYQGKRTHKKGKTIREFEILVWSEFDDDDPNDQFSAAQKKTGKAKSKKGGKKSKKDDDVPF